MEPRPRREMPCVVGWAASEEERRKRAKPGTMRRRSSRLMPGTCWTRRESRMVSEAGASAATFSTMVMEVWTGSAAGVAVGAVLAAGVVLVAGAALGADWARSVESVQIEDRIAMPAGVQSQFGRRREDEAEAVGFQG